MSLPLVPPAFLDGIGLSEMVVIAFLSILVFGGKLPDVMRNLGRSYAKFRQGLHDMSRPIREEIQGVSTLPATLEPTTSPAAAGHEPTSLAAYDVPAAPGGAPTPPPPPARPGPWPSAPARDPFEEPPPV